MKKLSLLLLLVALVATSTYAQDALQAYKKANKAFGAFKVDGISSEKLVEAHSYLKTIEDGLGELDVKKVLPKALLLMGDINSRIASFPVSNLSSQFPDASLDAYEAYIKVLDTEGFKKYVYANATTGLKNISQELINSGASLYEAKDFKNALVPFQAVLNIKSTLDARGGETILDNPDDFKSIAQYTGLTALLAKDNTTANGIFKSLLDDGVNDAFIYDGLWKANKEDDMEAAKEWLDKGRTAHPDDQGLLYSQINLYLGSGETAKLETLLKSAIEKDPDNKTLYSTLGNVFDNLYQDKLKEVSKMEDETAKKEAMATANKFFGNAEEYYNTALEKDPKYFDVWYGLGALYFNKAAKVINQRNKLPISAQKEYDALGKEASELFKKSYTKFVEAEKINPSDMSLVIAMKELYANTNQIVHSNEYKKRLKTLQEDRSAKFEPYANHPGVDSIKL